MSLAGHVGDEVQKVFHLVAVAVLVPQLVVVGLGLVLTELHERVTFVLLQTRL
jgi:hypothetical protein